MAFMQRIKLQNFAIFSNFECYLHRQLNFVTGGTRAGKSTIIYGLMLALGYELDQIDKARNFYQDFIQEDQARVEVVVARKDAEEEILLLVEIHFLAPEEEGDGVIYSYRHGDSPMVSSSREEIRNLLRRDFPDFSTECFLNEDCKTALCGRFFPWNIFPSANPPRRRWEPRTALRFILRTWKRSSWSVLAIDAPNLILSANSATNGVQGFLRLARQFPDKQFIVSTYKTKLEINETLYRIMHNPSGRCFYE